MSGIKIFAENSKNALGHWTQHGNKNIKNFFDSFALQRKLDPLIAANWYSVGVKSIFQHPEGRTVLGHYNGSLIKALQDIYPNIGLEEANFSNLTKGFWKSRSKHREFFDKFAKKFEFDALVADNWYDIKTAVLLEEKGAKSVISNYYGGSILSALIEVYPDVPFEQEKFGDKFWRTETNRKQFFDSFSSKKGFDYNVAENWYNQPVSEIIKEPEGAKVLSHYGGSLYKALQDVYPTMPLIRSTFLISKETRAQILSRFAEERHFDARNLQIWMALPTQLLLADKRLAMVLQLCYNGSISEAVKDVFLL
eukprot:Phypoly_transcript_14096.p1 GENE.Phypoly_transcript_14096~~Phypoly_transcript_14096.p1  ORF type:complete len:309 (-),score=47.32 Phypoly_transcript_14096:29-955(-)